MSLRDLSVTGTVFLSELRSAVRDRHVVIYSLVLPVFLYPALIFLIGQGAQYRSGALEKQTSRVAWEGEESFPRLFERLRQDGRFELLSPADPKEAVVGGRLDAYLRVSRNGRGEPAVEVLLDLSRDRSSIAERRIVEIGDALREEMLVKGLATLGATRAVIDVIDLREENVASAEEMGRFLLSLILPLILVLMLSMGAMYPAIDVLVGERERKTFEALLASGAPRLGIVTGKFLAVLAASFSALIANLASMLLTLKHQVSLFGGEEALSITVPWSALPTILLGGLLLGAFYAASMVLVASFARTFKEGQGYLTPFYLVCMIPAILGTVPILELRPATALIPLTNVTLLFRSALMGRFPPLPMLIVFLSLTAYLAGSLILARRIFAREAFFLGGPGGWRRVLRIPWSPRGGSRRWVR